MFKLLALSAIIVQASADPSALRSRRLSFSRIAGYEPRSQVTDHAAIALDQRSMEDALSNGDFELAEKIYNQGGSSKSFAVLTITGGVLTEIKKETPLSGTDVSGNKVTGTALQDTAAGSATLSFQYDTSDDQDAHSDCMVGALAASDQIQTGCLAIGIGTIVVNEGATLTYNYAAEMNNNARTLAGFSQQTKSKLHDCDECPYPMYMKFIDYYDEFNYGHQWISAAFSKTSTTFKGLGNQALGSLDDDGRVEVIKKGTAYLNVWMYVVYEMEDALNDCKSSCINCNDEPVHAWDEAVAFYAGSLEGIDGSGNGNLVYALSDKRCANFKTCGEDQNSLSGTSYNNIEIMRYFEAGQNDLIMGQCGPARTKKDAIEKLMAVPLVQGTLRYAYLRDYQASSFIGDKAEGEGAVFAASVLPILHACSAGDAQFVYDNMRVDFGKPDFKGVKAAFERNYECMGMTCANVGGVYNGVDGFYEHASPCSDAKSSSSKSKTGAIVGGVIGGLVLGLILAFAYFKFVRKGGASGKDLTFVSGAAAGEGAI